MKIIKTVHDFLIWRENQAGTLGFTPTLGALHEGHLSLIRASKKQCHLTIVSIFLNPTQFAPHEDLDSYPNTREEDIRCLKKLGIDILFLPTTYEMYGHSKDVNVPATKIFNKLEGASRPHFFYGVTTVVAKMFNIIQPTHVFFGEKDAQQLYIIQQMIKNMNYPIVLVPCPTIRDKHGLALSSRNQHLTVGGQLKASVIHKGLMHIKKGLDLGQKKTVILKETFKTILHQVPNIKIDYISIASSKTLEEVIRVDFDTLLISTAVFVEDVRLIDNFIYPSSTT
jgi:pantoate--beta-alanine ligase